MTDDVTHHLQTTKMARKFESMLKITNSSASRVVKNPKSMYDHFMNAYVFTHTSVSRQKNVSKAQEEWKKWKTLDFISFLSDSVFGDAESAIQGQAREKETALPLDYV